MQQVNLFAQTQFKGLFTHAFKLGCLYTKVHKISTLQTTYLARLDLVSPEIDQMLFRCVAIKRFCFHLSVLCLRNCSKITFGWLSCCLGNMSSYLLVACSIKSVNYIIVIMGNFYCKFLHYIEIFCKLRSNSHKI